MIVWLSCCSARGLRLWQFTMIKVSTQIEIVYNTCSAARAGVGDDVMPYMGPGTPYQPRIEVVGNGSASHKRPSGWVPFWSILVTRHSPFSRVGVLLQILASSVKPTISSPQPWSVEPSRRAAGSRRARQALGYLECHENRQLGSYTGHVFASVLPRALTISSRMHRDKI